MAEFLKAATRDVVVADNRVRETVAEMIATIDSTGMEGVRSYSLALDDWGPESFRVSDEEIAAASGEVTPVLKSHIAFAQEQIRTFAEAQLSTLADLDTDPLPGVRLGHRHIPVNAVGAYVPGGRYPMLASAFMTVLVPKVAGVSRVVACSPPWEGRGVHPAILYAMATSGADEIYCVGGVQALAFMALVSGESDPVDMLVGAGNAYVAEAKRQLYGRVGIDLLAGPTEILVIADDKADPILVAADLLGQAEHGPTSPGILITTSKQIGEAVLEQIERLLQTWPTAEISREAWAGNGVVVVARDDDEAIKLADEYAPEHLEVQVDPAKLDDYLARLTNYGSLFLGSGATVAYGDKAVGTNHVLPTSRAARYTGGLWVGKFLKTLTYQRVVGAGTDAVAPATIAIAEAEHMLGHAVTARMRLDASAQDLNGPDAGGLG